MKEAVRQGGIADLAARAWSKEHVRKCVLATLPHGGLFLGHRNHNPNHGASLSKPSLVCCLADLMWTIACGMVVGICGDKRAQPTSRAPGAADQVTCDPVQALAS